MLHLRLQRTSVSVEPSWPYVLFSTLQLPLQANLCLYSFFSFAFVIFSAATAWKITQWPPQSNICPVLYLLTNKRSAEHLSARQLRGFRCLMREKPLCVFQLEVEGEDEHSAVWQRLSVLSLSCVLDNKTTIAGMLGPIQYGLLHSWAFQQLQSHEKMRVFYLNLKQRSVHWLTPLALMTTSVACPRRFFSSFTQ